MTVYKTVICIQFIMTFYEKNLTGKTYIRTHIPDTGELRYWDLAVKCLLFSSN